MSRKSKSSSFGEREIEKASQQFEEFEQNVKDLTLDRMNEAPKMEMEQQTKLSQKEIEKSQDIYLKPKRSIYAPPDPKTGKAEKFNEKFREDYNFAAQHVHFIAENKEIIGETITIWTKPFPGMPAEEWDVPCNKPVWGPRYLAEQIKRCTYHRLQMKEDIVGQEGAASYYGRMVADTTIQRLDAHPVSQRKSIFMGSGSF